MHAFKYYSLLVGLALFSKVSATTLITSQFSPYVDLTLNTHWDQQTQQLEPMDLTSLAKNQGILAYRLAFITDSGVCQPAWGGLQDYSVQKLWGKSQIEQLSLNGVSISISFGGANGNDISLHCSETQLVHTLYQVIEKYHADSLDFDIENGSADVVKLVHALRIVQQQHPKIKLSFTLPVMPEGLTAMGKDVVILAKQEGLNFNVNIMAMDYGPAYNGDMGEYAILAATNLHQFFKELYPDTALQTLWNRIEVTPMIGVNDVNTEQFTLQNAYKLKQFALKNKLGGLSMWSLTRDKPCPDQWASPICSGNNLQKHDYEFLASFK